MAGLTAATLAWPAMVSSTEAESTKLAAIAGPIVLVHGAWHGGWVWRHVADHLRQMGHDVHAPSLTGLGSRRHLADLAINLSTHVDDLVGLIESEEMRNAIVVAHSYAGMVATAAVGRIHERLAGLVFLDAFIPADGESMLTWTDPATVTGSLATARAGRFLLPPPPAAFGIGPADSSNSQWLERRLDPHPLATLFERARVNEDVLLSLPRTAIVCTEPVFNPALPDHLAKRFDDSGYRLHELAAPHNAMVTHPNQVAKLIHEVTA